MFNVCWHKLEPQMAKTPFTDQIRLYISSGLSIKLNLMFRSAACDVLERFSVLLYSLRCEREI